MSDLYEAVESAGDNSSVPDKAYRALADSLDHVTQLKVACRGKFQEDWDRRADRHAAKVQRNANLTVDERAAIQTAADVATAAPAAQKMSDVFNNPYRPGDAKRIKTSDPEPAVKRGKYTGFFEVYVARGDSIETLAWKHMGDPDGWRDIAMINNLRPPFITQDARIPNTKKIGDPITIPLAKQTQPSPVVSTGASNVGASQAEEFMGTDIRLIQLSNGKYGWAVDTAHGSTDIQTISGVPNLVQGVGTRFRTEQGTNPQFPTVGMPNMVGEKSQYQLWLEARFALEGQILDDPRIDRVISIQFEVVNDVLEMNVSAQPVGYNTSRVLPVQVR
jgi:hypothetical protein